MIVISKIYLPNELTKGKSYQVLFVEWYDNGQFARFGQHKKWIFYIMNDSGTKARYFGESFLSLQEHRELNIDKILEDDSNI